MTVPILILCSFIGSFHLAALFVWIIRSRREKEADAFLESVANHFYAKGHRAGYCEALRDFGAPCELPRALKIIGGRDTEGAA